MKHFTLLIPITAAVFLFKSGHILAQPLKGLAVVKEGFSSELELVVDQLAKSEKLSIERANQVASAAAVINSDLEKAPLSNALFLVKSEIYKGLLDNPLLSQSDEILLNESLVKGIEEKISNYKVVYSDFSKWLTESILEELVPYREENFLDKYQTVSGNDVKGRAKALRLKRLARYLSPWLLALNERTPEEFNRLATEVAADLLLKIANKSYYFKEFTSRYSSANIGKIFSVPNVNLKKEPTEPLPATSLKEQGREKMLESSETIKALEGGELENPSKAIDGLMRSESQKGEAGGWTPK